MLMQISHWDPAFNYFERIPQSGIIGSYDMASSPITSWEIDGETVETVRLYFSENIFCQFVLIKVSWLNIYWFENTDFVSDHLAEFCIL